MLTFWTRWTFGTLGTFGTRERERKGSSVAAAPFWLDVDRFLPLDGSPAPSVEPSLHYGFHPPCNIHSLIEPIFSTLVLRASLPHFQVGIFFQKIALCLGFHSMFRFWWLVHRLIFKWIFWSERCWSAIDSKSLHSPRLSKINFNMKDWLFPSRIFSVQSASFWVNTGTKLKPIPALVDFLQNVEVSAISRLKLRLERRRIVKVTQRKSTETDPKQNDN